MAHLNPDAFDCDLGDSVVVFEQRGAEYFRLRGVGREIWLMLKSGHEIGGIVERLLVGYDVARDECQRSVESFLGELASKNLVIPGKC
jgi:hypothetical protein